ncbi:hypothetical protein [Streptomyces prunicolor]
MSAYSSDRDLNVHDVTGTEVDVATNPLNGDIRLSNLWTQEILLPVDAADQVADALRRAAAQSRSITAAPSADRGTTFPTGSRRLAPLTARGPGVGRAARTAISRLP